MTRIEIRTILEDLVDRDECSYDHHGYCQAHGWFEVDPICPHARAKTLLASPQAEHPQTGSAVDSVFAALLHELEYGDVPGSKLHAGEYGEDTIWLHTTANIKAWLQTCREELPGELARGALPHLRVQETPDQRRSQNWTDAQRAIAAFATPNAPRPGGPDYGEPQVATPAPRPVVDREALIEVLRRFAEDPDEPSNGWVFFADEPGDIANAVLSLINRPVTDQGATPPPTSTPGGDE